MDSIPVVQTTAERDFLFPSPQIDQRVYNKQTTREEMWSGAAWLTLDLGGTFVGAAATLAPGRLINGVLFDGSVNITVTAAAGTLTGVALAAGVTASSLTSVGVLTSLTVAGTVTLTAAVSQLVPGATSFSVRNNANNADNLIITDAGLATLRNKVHIGLNSTQGGEASIYGLSVTKDVQNGAGGSQFAFAGEMVAIDSTNDVGGAQHLSGAQVAAVATSAANYHELWGAHVYSTVSVGGTVDLAIGTYTQANQTSGTLLCGVGAEVYVIRSGGAMTTAIGLAVGYHSTHVSQGFDAVATNQYGIRVGPIINGTLNYAWYSEDGWVQFGDSVSIGTGVVPVTNARLFVSGSVPAVGGFAQGVIVSPTVTSGATNSAFGITLNVATAAAAFTCPTLVGLNIGDAVKGAGSAITTQYGIKISSQTQGGTNWAVFTGTNRSHFGGVVEMDRWEVSDTRAAGTIWNGRGFTDGILYIGRDDVSNILMVTPTQLLPRSGTPLIFGAASQTWGKAYFGPSAFSNARGFLNVRADHNVDNSIYLEDSNGSPHDAWAIGHSTGGSFNGLGFYNYTAAALRLQLFATGLVQINAGGLDVTGTITLRNQLVFTVGSATSLGTSDNFGLSFKTNALVRWSVNTNGNLEGDTTNGGSIKMGPAASKIVAGATSLSLRNNADNADNVLVEDAGVVTLRNQIKFTAGGATSLGTTDAFGFSFKTQALVRWSIDTSGNLIGDTTNGGYVKFGPAVSKIIPGATSVSLRNTADSADNLIIVDAGDATLRTKLTMPGPLVLTTAAAKIVAGATSVSLRNNADNADNILVEDAGVITFRNQLKFAAGASTSLGTSDNFGLSFKTNALVRFSISNTGDIQADTANGGTITFRPGTQSTYTAKTTGVLKVWNALSTTSTSEVSLGSFVLKGGTLTADGQYVRLVIHGDMVTQAGVFKVVFGATNVENYTVPVSTEFTIYIDIWRFNGASAQKARKTRMATGGTGSEAGSAPAENLAADVTIDLRGSVTSGGTLSIHGATLEYVAA